MKKTVFISYSHTSQEYVDWVIELASKLVTSGIDVKFDQFDLKEGHDLNAFMEQSVNSTEVDKVLLLLDKGYKEKADKRKSGVGTETLIISPEIYSDVKQEKFIPVVCSKDENNNPFIPTFLKSRLYIDLSDENSYEENFEKLLRNIVGSPIVKKPILGKVPEHILTDKSQNYKTSFLQKGLEKQLDKHPERVDYLVKEFLDSFIIDLKEFELNINERNNYKIGEEIFKSISKITPLRNDYISFLDKILRMNYNFNNDLIVSFLEELNIFKRPLTETSSYYSYITHNFEFIAHEIVIYTIACGLRNENYSFLNNIINATYFPKDKHQYHIEPKSLDFLYKYIDSIQVYLKESTKLNISNPMSKVIFDRIPEPFKKEDIINADLLCHYISEFNNKEWYPVTSYHIRTYRVDFMVKLVSKRHFEKIKIAFNSLDLESFKNRLKEMQSNNKNNGYDRITPIFKLINIDDIATLP